jgi:basic amino acid/polyamine antiporter, APA family
MKAVVLLIFAYGGFESAMAPMSEARNPGRDAAFALLIALIVCTTIYALVQWTVVGVLGPASTSARPLAEVARATMGNRGAGLVAIGALISMYGYLSAKLLAMPRVTFALAKAGDLPSLFAAVSPKFRTPWFSILFYSVAVWALAIAGNFTWNVTLSVFARLFYYGVVCAALIALRRERPAEGVFRLPGGAWIAVLGVGICAGVGIAAVLSRQVDLSKSIILEATIVAAFLNWLWARRRKTS